MTIQTIDELLEANGFLDTIYSQKCWDEEGKEIECPEYY